MIAMTLEILNYKILMRTRMRLEEQREAIIFQVRLLAKLSHLPVVWPREGGMECNCPRFFSKDDPPESSKTKRK